LLYSLKTFWVSRVSGVQLRGFATRPTHQGYNGGNVWKIYKNPKPPAPEVDVL